MHPSADPWTLQYWKAEISAGRAPACLDPGRFRNLGHVNLAWEAAFELRDWPAAQWIAQAWTPYLNPNQTEYNSPWVNRELLYFLRGKQEGKWLDLLLDARASMLWRDGSSFLSRAFEEVYAQLDMGEPGGVARLCEVVPKLLANGAVVNDPVSFAHVLPQMRGKVEALAPGMLPQWDAMLVAMDHATEIHGQYGELDIRLEDAIIKEDLSALATLVPQFLAIPRPYRTLSPLVLAVSRPEKVPGYPVVEAVRALVEAGLPMREVDADGFTPLSAVMDARLPPGVVVSLLDILLAAGADPNQRNEQVWSTQSQVSALDCPLHGCSLRIDPPVAQLIAAGADLEARDDRGMTPLLYACREGNLHAMARLVAAGANVHATGEDTGTAAFEYLENLMRLEKDFSLHSEEMAAGCALLFQAGADLCPVHAGMAAWAVLFGYLEDVSQPNRAQRLSQEFIAALVDTGCDVDWQHIHDAALPFETAAPARAILQRLLLERETDVARSRPAMRRM